MSVVHGAEFIFSQAFHDRVDSHLLNEYSGPWHRALSALRNLESLERSFEHGRETYSALVRTWMLMTVEKIITDKHNSLVALKFEEFFSLVEQTITDYDRMALQGWEKEGREAEILKSFVSGKDVPFGLERSLEYTPDLVALGLAGLTLLNVDPATLSSSLDHFAAKYGFTNRFDKLTFVDMISNTPTFKRNNSEPSSEDFNKHFYTVENDHIQSKWKDHYSKIAGQKNEMILSLYVSGKFSVSSVSIIMEFIQSIRYIRHKRALYFIV